MGRRRQALLVEDEWLIRYALDHSLRDEGMDVCGVESAELALQTLEGNAYDLCLLDLRLPGMGGLEAMEIIRQRSPATSIVVMTAEPLEGDRRRAVERTALGVLPKPFDLDRVKHIARKLDWTRRRDALPANLPRQRAAAECP